MEKYEPTPDYKKAEKVIEPEQKNLSEMRNGMISSLEKMGKKGFLNKELIQAGANGLDMQTVVIYGEIDGHDIHAIAHFDPNDNTVIRSARLTVDDESMNELFPEFYETYSQIAYDINMEEDEKEKLKSRKSQEERLALQKEKTEDTRKILF